MCKSPRKTQGVWKTLEKTQDPQKKTQEPKIRSKNPRSWEKTQGVATCKAPLSDSEALIKTIL